MFTRTFNLFQIICGFLVIFTLAGTVHGQGLSPAHEQEFMDAKSAIQAAQTAKADKYAPDKAEGSHRIPEQGRTCPFGKRRCPVFASITHGPGPRRVCQGMVGTED